MKRAILSVSDKRDLGPFAQALLRAGYELYSTGGTAVYLREHGLEVIDISSYTQFPEMLSGRVKTLHPKIFAGILARPDQPLDQAEMAREGLDFFDLVVVNLYPFRETLRKELPLAEQIEEIDIGGPSLLRAAAKNHAHITVVSDPLDYPVIIEALERGELDLDLRRALAAKVYETTAAYDAMIARYLSAQTEIELAETPYVTGVWELKSKLRYGENPAQAAEVYQEIPVPQDSLLAARQIQGKDLSYNNYGDAVAAVQALHDFSEPTVIALKHANPCGVASANTIEEAWDLAYAADPISIFGGIVAQNREVTGEEAQKMAEIFLELIIAPSYAPTALEILGQKKNLRLLHLPSLASGQRDLPREWKFIPGGLLIQDADAGSIEDEKLTVVTKTKVLDSELRDYIFAQKVCRLLKSNAIAVCQGQQTLGIGPGQTNRVGAAKIALEMAGEKARGAILASDAFFPFADTCALAHEYGIRGIIQPGGSVRDQDSIDFCNEHGIAMIFTGQRHFKH